MKKRHIFKYLIHEWLIYHKDLIKESTFASYDTIAYNYLIPAFGKYDVKEINNRLIQEKVILWLKEGRLDHSGGLCEKSVRNIICVLKICMKYANKMGYSNLNNIDVIYPKECKDNKIKVFSKSNQDKLIKCVYKKINNKSIGILLALGTGIRIGELCAIQWRDIDLDNRVIYITKTVQRLFLRKSDGSSYTKVLITTPKTSTSIREIPLSNEIVRILNEIYIKDKEIYLLTGTNKHMEPRTYRSYYDRFLKRNGIEHINFHSLRHTFATMCIQAGGDYKTVSELLGHATVNMTLNIYVHPQMEEKRKCIELISMV